MLAAPEAATPEVEMIEAIRTGNAETLVRLIAPGRPITGPMLDALTPETSTTVRGVLLCFSAMRNDLAAVNKLLQNVKKDDMEAVLGVGLDGKDSLHFAVANNFAHVVFPLLTAGAVISEEVINAIHSEFTQASMVIRGILICFAAIRGELAKLESLLSLDSRLIPMVLGVGINNKNALCLAIEHEHQDVANRLLAAGAPVGDAVIYMAVAKSNLSILNPAIRHIVQNNIPNVQMIAAILKAGASLEDAFSAISPATSADIKGILLYIAAERGNTAIAEQLINSGVDTKASALGAPIVAAVKGGHTELVERLLEKDALGKGSVITPEDYAALKALLNKPDEQGKNALSRAVHAKKVRLTQLLLSIDSSISDRLLEEIQSLALPAALLQSLAVYLVNQGRVEAATVLLEKRTEISSEFISFAIQQPNKLFLNARDASGRTALSTQVTAGNIPAVIQLLKAGAEISAEVLSALKPEIPPSVRGLLLRFAAERGELHSIEALAQPDIINVNCKIDDEENRSHLSFALRAGRNKAALLLLKKGANPLPLNEADKRLLNPIVNTPDRAGKLPLLSAVEAKDIVQMRSLLAARASITEETLDRAIELDYQSEPKMILLILFGYAAINGDLDAINKLSGKNIGTEGDGWVNINADLSGRGETALYLAVKNHQDAAVKQLLAHGAFINEQTINAAIENHNQTLLDITLIEAAKVNNIPLAVRLLGAGANVNQVNDSGYSPLSAAIANERDEMTDFLLQQPGIQVDHPRNNPLHLAAANKNSDLVEELLRRGADPNAADDEDITPLMRAVDHKNLRAAEMDQVHSIVTALLAAGADKSKTDKYGFTAMDLVDANKGLFCTYASLLKVPTAPAYSGFEPAAAVFMAAMAAANALSYLMSASEPEL